MARPHVRPEDPDEGVRIQTKLPPEWAERWQALEEHWGTTRSAVASDILRDAVLQFEGGKTNRSRLQRIEEIDLVRIERKVDMALLLAWRAVACDGQVLITADEVKRLKELVQEIAL